MVMVIGVMSVLMFGVTSAILIASHAAPDPDDENTALRSASAVLDEISEEVRTALWFTNHEKTTMTFTVPDRDGNGEPERITYNWSGNAGDPLWRQYNGGSKINLLAEVQDLAFSYDTTSIDETYPGPPVESAEVLHASYTGSDDLTDFSVQDDTWIGQYFTPSVPGDALSWSVTRVQFIAASHSTSTGTIGVQLREADGSNKPTDTVIEEQTLLESSLSSSFGVQEFAFSTVTGLPVGSGLCLVLKHLSGSGTSARVVYDDDDGAGRVTTASWGSSWNHDNAKAMRFAVYGKYVSPGPTQTVTRQYVTQVGVTLQPTNDAASRITTAAPTYNMPELLSSYWTLDFSATPKMDHNGDGTDDWEDWEAAFETADLSGGIWSAPIRTSPNRHMPYTRPDSDFTGVTTVEYRARATSTGGSGAYFWINADRAGTQTAPIYSVLFKPDAGSQVLRLGLKDPSALTSWPGQFRVADDFVTVRLVIDPALDTVAVWADGAHQGTFAYPWGATESGAAAWLYADGCSADFDYISIRTSE